MRHVRAIADVRAPGARWSAYHATAAATYGILDSQAAFPSAGRRKWMANGSVKSRLLPGRADSMAR